MSNSRSIDLSFHGVRQLEHRLMSSQVKEENKTTTASFARNRDFFARALGRPVSP